MNKMIRTLSIGRIKESCLSEYITAHESVWPELVNEYKKYGMHRISCFISGCVLYVFLEYEERFLENKHLMEYDARWQLYMETLVENKEDEVMADEVFHFNHEFV